MILRIALSAAMLAAVSTAAHAEANERVWSFREVGEKQDKEAFLSYGVPETDDTLGSFSCKPGSGAVVVWIMETSSKLKAGKMESAVFSVGATRTTVAGKLMLNEEAGVPSFKGALAANDPIFAAMAKVQGKARAGAFVVTVGPSKQAAPLESGAGKFEKFAAACAKK